MFTEINRQLGQAQHDIFRLNQIDTMLKHLRAEQRSLKTKVQELKGKLAMESRDVQKLEGGGLAALFSSVLGDLEKRMEKERQEALAAKLNYDQAIADLGDVEQEIEQLVAERRCYSESHSTYRCLYAQKREMLEKTGSPAAQQLMEYSEELNDAKNRLQEVNEAIAAGGAVLGSLDSTLRSLGSAKGWGTWDVLGGGLLTSIVKHSHIDSAKEEAERAHVLLRRFNTELSDVQINENMHFETGGFAKFADFFFDGLLADLFMQSKINNSRASVERVQSEVQQVMGKLEEMRAWESSKIKKLDEEIKNLVIGTK